MTATSKLIQDTLRELRSGAREQHNQINGAHDASTTTINLDRDTTHITEGSVLSVGIEELYVWSVSTTSVEVSRGWGGSTAAALTDGQLVTVNPRVSEWSVFNELNTELRAVAGDLYRILSVDLTTSATEMTYNLTGVTGLLDVYDVLVDTSASDNSWPRVPLRQWELRRNMPTGEFPSGFALRLHADVDAGRTMRVIYKAAFGSLTALADDVETVTGLPASAVDILSLGAQARLMAYQESKRSALEAQGSARRAGEVQPGSATRTAASLLRLRDLRIAEERTKLDRQYPPRK